MQGHIRKYKDRYAGVIYLGTDEFGRKKTKWLYNKDKKQLEKMVREYIVNLESGNIIPSDNITFEQLFNRWISSQKIRCVQKTISGYKSVYKVHLKPLKNINIQKLTSGQIQLLYNNILKNSNSKTVLRVHQVLRTCIRYAYSQRLILRNIMDFVVVPKKTKKKYTICSVDYYKELLNLSKESDWTHLYMLLLLTGGLGLRVSEAIAITKNDIITDTKYEDTYFLRVNKQLTYENGKLIVSNVLKTESSIRTIAIPPDVYNLINNFIKEQDLNLKKYNIPFSEEYYLISRSDGKKIPVTSIQRHWRQFKEKYNLLDIRIHDLRHFNATLMMDSGIPDKVSQNRLGHSSINMTEYYQHPSTEIDKKYSEKIKIVL